MVGEGMGKRIAKKVIKTVEYKNCAIAWIFCK